MLLTQFDRTRGDLARDPPEGDVEVGLGTRVGGDGSAHLTEDGADAIIAGCTEIELALTADDVDGAFVPTTSALMDAAVAWLVDGEVPTTP